jgi:hypothetical protein
MVVAHVSKPAATTVYGLTSHRLWATMDVALALIAVLMGGLALTQRRSHFGKASDRLGAILAVVAGPIAVING